MSSKIAIYKAKSDKGLYHYLENGKLVPGQKETDKAKLDPTQFEIVDASMRTHVRCAAPAKENPLNKLDLSAIDYAVKTKITSQNYKDLFASKGWGLTSKACSVYLRVQKPLSELGEYLDELAEKFPNKGSISFDVTTGSFSIVKSTRRTKVQAVTEAIEAISVSE